MLSSRGIGLGSVVRSSRISVCGLRRSFTDGPGYPPPIRYNPITPTEQCILAAGSAVFGLWNPYSGNYIAILGETTGKRAIERMHCLVRATEEGRSLLADQPRWQYPFIHVPTLLELPENTLGHTYATFMNSHEYDPLSRINVQFMEDPQLAYLMQRYRETHDVLHAVFGLPPTVLGEIVLKWIEWYQTGLPMTALASMFGPMRLNVKERKMLAEVYLPWATEQARRAPLLLGKYFEKYIDKDVNLLRKEWNIEAAPMLDKMLAISSG